MAIMFTFPLCIFNSSSNSVLIPFDYLGGEDIFYYLGTNKKTTTFTNPATTNIIVNDNSGAGYGSPVSLTGRSRIDYYTQNSFNSWVKFQFNTCLVNPNYYVMQVSDYGGYYPRSWKLEGSNNNNTWDILDTRTNNTVLDTNLEYGGFSCISSTFYKYLKITQTGLNSFGDNFFIIFQVMVYGNIQFL